MDILKSMVTDEMLSKQPKDKQIALLKAERNTLLAIASIEDSPLSCLLKINIMTQGAYTIKAILSSEAKNATN